MGSKPTVSPAGHQHRETQRSQLGSGSALGPSDPYEPSGEPDSSPVKGPC